jgi:hypothetical protein
MGKPLLLSVLFLLTGSVLFGQKKLERHWGKNYLDVAYSAAATNDGGYIITGLTKNGIADPYGEIIVIKTDAKADTLWTLVYGGPKLEGGNSVIQTADGGFMVSGHTEDFGAKDCDAFLMKLDKNGNYEWLKVYGDDADDISEGVIQLPDGGYVFAGITASYGNPPGGLENRHVYFVRTNSTGEVIWTKYYASNFVDYGYSIAAMANGGFLAVGWSQSSGQETDGWLFRLKDNGDTLWTRLYKKEGDSRYFKIIPTLDKGYVIAGYTTLNMLSKPQGLLIKLDADGNQRWEKTFGTTSEGITFHDIAQLPNGNFMLTGANFSTDTAGVAYILTTDADGNKLLDDLCGGSGSYTTSIAVQGNNSYLVAGTSSQYGDPYGDLYYMEVDNTISGIPAVSFALPHIFPNPVKDRSSIILPTSEAYRSTSLDIVSIDGKFIYSLKNVMAKDLIIYRNSLPAGSYLFIVNCKDGKVYRGKFEVD